jgi:arsenate reductase
MNTLADSLFRALADKTRLRCVALLETRGELCVCELTHGLSESQPKISRHLAYLKKAGVVRIRRDGLWIHYRINPDLPAWAIQVIRSASYGLTDTEPFLQDSHRLSQVEPYRENRCSPAVTSRKKNILFICTGNSCRSQMAEGWGRFYANEAFEVRSAGLEPSGVNPTAIRVMEEVGIDISTQESTALTPGLLEWADILIALCKHAFEHCLVTPGRTIKEHWSVEDPSVCCGTEEQVMNTFRATRNKLQQRVRSLLGTICSDHQTT